MIGAGEFLPEGWTQTAVVTEQRGGLDWPSQQWHAQSCLHLWAADELSARLLERMQSLGYQTQDCRDLASNLRGIWPAWFRHDDWRWNPRGVEVSAKVCAERAVLVLRPGADFGGDETRMADCRAAERAFRMHQPLMKGYSTWLRFDARGRCIALCKYASQPRA